LKQVYLNLILNALDAMTGGGTLGVTTGGQGGWISVTIADTGAGIPSEKLSQIGDPFFTTKPRGSGLGLFLTRRLVQSGGGRLEITSEVGKGTSCVVRWPERKGAVAT